MSTCSTKHRCLLTCSKGEALNMNFMVNGHECNQWYYLVVSIYLWWLVFVKTIRLPQALKQCILAAYQEDVHKDVGRAFGVLKARFPYSC
jgi:hypothetical protein